MKKQLSSFKVAFEGLFYTVTHEGHFRFHLVAAAYVIFFGARFYDFSRGEWLALILTISAVLSLECLNTALERLGGRVSADYDREIKRSKDAAAAAVLLAAVAATAVAVLMFLDFDVIKKIFEFYISHIWDLTALLLSAAASAVFVALCKTEDK